MARRWPGSDWSLAYPRSKGQRLYVRSPDVDWSVAYPRSKGQRLYVRSSDADWLVAYPWSKGQRLSVLQLDLEIKQDWSCFAVETWRVEEAWSLCIFRVYRNKSLGMAEVGLRARWYVCESAELYSVSPNCHFILIGIDTPPSPPPSALILSAGTGLAPPSFYPFQVRGFTSSKWLAYIIYEHDCRICIYIYIYIYICICICIYMYINTNIHDNRVRI